MWVFMSGSFVSIVKPDAADVPKAMRGKDLLLVRGRRREDLTVAFPGSRILRTPGRDYAFRTFVPRERVAARMAGEVQAIDYGNFKGSVRSAARHDAYMDVWSAMNRFQNEHCDAPTPSLLSRQRD